MYDLISSAECVLFDFDGPVCRLFSGHPSAGIAQRMRDLVAEHGQERLLGEEARSTGDPQVVLRTVAAARPGGELAALLERALTEEEMRAAAVARPTPYADPLVQTLAATGRRLAVTTNNSARAAELYLTGRRLAPYFSGHIHGRRPDTRLLKPHPDCLHRALESTGTRPERALMIGDSPVDLLAAGAAGVRFLGYARNGGKAEQLREAGASHVVTSLQDVLTAVRTPTFG
ncbi:HAD family hydrolase [Streptomyces radiopugnans]|jgi:HAD superfamily hydrolase (TIGR01509 family)|uniref:Haloacid dehalogenase superfamily, subfamily IA, variant 3 with third motif having DD or ED/haloacid dehalogenase superfamily, subfamily IA, variant 1 with third motif having Dx(3-4)D or Dx(3-4)E n=1 Tax=Streptomyces radiopugnans TaxID=403935 RepID=A0A1H9ECB0_9ACTN|nr:HAD family hydrolase [Streptomyces radiopugnans]SEQ23285.1 haloacid dehalogenase superfamily, subfamily IA, variant 3 with third motif having DD or ED/haloacid dehalogenase superfamily, subfamily IA, variant 1 with third motif having Dx(3-4)D or Dx(3-4)E [Streptomyces radiopugnans]